MAKSGPKYAVFAGFALVGGSRVWVSFGELCRLYGVKQGDCMPGGTGRFLIPGLSLVELRPRDDGNYALPKEEDPR